MSLQYCTVSDHAFRLNSVPTARLHGQPSGESLDELQSDHTISLYERALVRDPNNHLLLFDLASAYALGGRIRDSERMLVRVLNLYPRSAMVRSKVARLYQRINRPMQAIEHFCRALELDPQHQDSTTILADLSPHSPQAGG